MYSATGAVVPGSSAAVAATNAATTVAAVTSSDDSSQRFNAIFAIRVSLSVIVLSGIDIIVKPSFTT